MKYTFIILFGLSVHLCFSQTIKPAQIDSLIDGIKKTVLENYVLTDKANLISYSLTARHYAGISSIDSLTKKLNDDLFKLSDDKHLFLQYRPEVAENLIKQKDIHKEQDKKEKKEHYGFEQADVIGNNIGYIKLKYFADATHAQKAVLKYTSRLKNTSAIIFDLRENFGGSGTMIQLLAGIFLPTDQEEILKINYKTQDDVTLKSTQIDPTQKITHQPIYILVSSQTFSAGEAFTLIMKNRGRATIIGESTAGAGNVAGPYPVTSQFVLTVPVGIIVDPKTNVGWEHTGVTPDITVSADLAMDKAIELITSGTK
ncbi:MAG: S41 family peptidase [Saprospiraceae bacterium]|uniref:S41 family peptidase n=1 Tax=Candidatus Opimibacter skivensis TaxID=2982028 RepID=A0A9D7SRN6_9BACT|nr:S41 family peptidase [Candidatus Opimibacter skivensis]